MSFNKSNLSLAVACAALAIPTFLQLRAEAETFVDVARIPLMFDGFTADNVGSFVLGKPLAEQPARQVLEKEGPRGLLCRGLSTRLLVNGVQCSLFAVAWKLLQARMVG